MRAFQILFPLLVFTSLLSFDLAFGSSASFYYSDGPWSGKIIDAETKEPIEGVVVLAVWEKVYATPAGDNSYFFDAVEVLTNKEGKFLIPKFRAFNIIPVIRRIEGPDFTIFKPGYTPFGSVSIAAYHYFYKYFPYSPLRVDRKSLIERFKNDIVIELMRLKTKEERLDVIPHSSDPFRDHNEKKREYIKLLNTERKELGLEPYPETGGSR